MSYSQGGHAYASVLDNEYGSTTHFANVIYSITCNPLYADIIHEGGPVGVPEGILFYEMTNTSVKFRLRTVGQTYNDKVPFNWVLIGWVK